MHKNAMRRRRKAVGKRLRDCFFIGAKRRKVSPVGDGGGMAFVYVTNNPSVNSLCSLPPPFTQRRLLSGAKRREVSPKATKRRMVVYVTNNPSVRPRQEGAVCEHWG